MTCTCEHCLTNKNVLHRSFEAEIIEDEKRRDRHGLMFTILATALGFMFWPFMVTFLSGHDLFDVMADSVWQTVVWTMVMTVTAALCGIFALVTFKDRS